MNTTHFQTNDTTSLTSKLVKTILTFIGGTDSQDAALARAYANELRSQPGLASWILSIADFGKSERTELLCRAAAAFRGEWATYGLSDTFTRIAGRPALFRSVVRELSAPLAQAA